MRVGRDVVGKLLVVDMGGGTLDVALLDIHAELGLDPEISVLSSWGVDEAGDALDDAVAADLQTEDLADLGVDVDALAPGAVLQAAREAKLHLTHDLDTVVAVRDPRVVVATPLLQPGAARGRLRPAASPCGGPDPRRAPRCARHLRGAASTLRDPQASARGPRR